jgi:hypothetical protein
LFIFALDFVYLFVIAHDDDDDDGDACARAIGGFWFAL